MELFPNMIDYVCNPDVDPVSRANCLQPAPVPISSVSFTIGLGVAQEPMLDALDEYALLSWLVREYSGSRPLQFTLVHP